MMSLVCFEENSSGEPNCCPGDLCELQAGRSSGENKPAQASAHASIGRRVCKVGQVHFFDFFDFFDFVEMSCHGVTAQVAYVMRQKIPFGIAQIGKAFRNEITPRPGRPGEAKPKFRFRFRARL